MNERNLEDLQAYKERLEADIRRSRLQDNSGYGLDNNSPLMRNYRQVQQDIQDYKPPTE